MAGGSSAVHMVARTSKTRSWTWSRYGVAADDWSPHVGFGGLATKPSDGQFLSLGLKTKPEGPTRQRRSSGRVREASKRETRGVIVELASEGSKAVVDACPLDGNIQCISNIAPEGYVSIRG